MKGQTDIHTYRQKPLLLCSIDVYMSYVREMESVSIFRIYERRNVKHLDQVNVSIVDGMLLLHGV